MTHGAAISARSDHEPRSVQSYARLAGILGLISVVAGGFGEGYVPTVMLVAGDAAATAQRILGQESLFRWGFAGFLVESLCDATLTMAFWVLVRPVHRNLAMLMVVLRIISTCGFAAAQVFHFGALTTLRTAPSLAALPPGQAEALAYLLLRIGGFGGALFSTFYGVANVLFGGLLYRSRLVPRAFGVAMVITGVAFALRTFLLILAPRYASVLLLATAPLAIIPLIAWLLVKGVDEEAWRRAERAA
ncbi:DUF4386 domain-containing protein [Roseisolibacter agri]|uniref:DUF4386 domain-containing protein n=1 Tax=Roseisolibacter agri TaxID=2014610 RepID=A0AA37Q1C2_9BACT|nr:DUF4386 domain-containing protein [Roseisolibacter agri]GLC24709.1 hypothetical protein rosag_12220 [Roseisolibacter agri]